MIKSRLLVAVAPAALVLGLTPASALAQEQPATSSAAQDPGVPQQQSADSVTPVAGNTDVPADAGTETGSDVVVTGSRIRRPNLESTVPITSITGEEFFQTGRTSVGDTLNELPALRSTFSQSNSTRFLGTAGLSLLDLRGLGSQRTLVLVNGRRHVAGDILNNAVSPDVNTIPTDLIERVDTVTGGNSAIYGSDALAGVVNFILKDNFDGVQIRGQGGASQYGDAGSYYVSALAGKNFADGRGNIALNLEYSRQNDFYGSGRPNLRNTQGFITVDTDPATATNGSDGVVDTQFVPDIRSGIYSNGGTFLSYLGGDSYTPYLFTPSGQLILQTGTPVGLAPLPSYIGGNGSSFREGRQLALSPALDRYSANLIAKFEVSPAFVPFLEAKYVRTDSIGSQSGPFFFSGGTTGSPRERFSTANPFLSAQARGVINDYYGYAPNEVGTFTFIRNVVELSNRDEQARRETYRAVGGVRGTFNDDWNYEVSANYGEFREKTRILGNVNLQRFLLAIDAVDAGVAAGGAANGQVVCRSQVSPAARIAFEGAGDAAFAQSQLAADVAACVPINLFGEGNISNAARGYLLQDSRASGKITQFVASGFVSGDSSQLFELPGGPIGFAIGAEYRRETTTYTQDAATAAGLTFYNAIPPFSPPSFEVKEAFGEIRLPIIRDSFIHELSLSGAARVADYKGATGTVYSYNAGIDFAPVRDLRFRGNYSRAVRAPNLTELFTVPGQNFATVGDPCSARNIGTGSATRAANCAADGVPAGYDFVYRQSLGFLSGGNSALQAEKSDSYTVGGVFQPRFIPGFSLSADYFDITVNDVITSPSAQGIINACYDAADLNNQFCALFARAGAGGGPRGEIRGQILENNLQVIPLNYAKLKVRGIDFEAAYQKRLSFGTVSLRAIYTFALQNDTFLSPTDPSRADQVLYELGDPKHAFNVNSSVKLGAFTIGHKLRYIGKMTPGAYENTFSKQGRPPQNADAFPIVFYPERWYNDVRIDIEANNRFNFYLGVDNVANELPPFGLTGVGGGSAIYNNTGRFFYAGAVAKF
ncbi:TonB-dependent receptor domain-containing protein [Sphingomonas sp.]|uniref:TonB-dependent receptor domain-containing protein n=1 Tax=Sphingomonas sp. TaxID=28214 RepID=UPI002D80F6B4|nr:TonB-dependent receptor [Sphingomonas sp.]HEU0044869.1 TonB-dependent receptor [Sphingomonas sp.]